MQPDVLEVPLSAKQMYSLGPRTEEAVRQMFHSPQGSLFPTDRMSGTTLPRDDFEFLSRALLNPKWSDEQAEELIKSIAVRRAAGEHLDLPLISRWVLAHHNKVSSVLLCMGVDPPPEIQVRRVLSQAGSQKVVFLASWRLTQREVVIKQLLRADGTAERELQSFPLNISHPNIIQTHRLQNSKGEVFLVEELLTEVLQDGREVEGIHEAANLLYDIGAAIKYLHDHSLVHGDIKPDNIGKRQGDFVLLDFGICRPISEFVGEVTATGSLRTRAPELLATDRYTPDPTKVDVWALGATLFSFLEGRFPLIDPDEVVPRVSNPSERIHFEKELVRRATDEWERRVTMEKVPGELRTILTPMLEREVAKRATSAQVLSSVERLLPAFLRGVGEKASKDGRFSPLEELEQIEEYLHSMPSGTPLPSYKRISLRERLKELEVTQGFSVDHTRRAQGLVESLG